MSVLSSANVNCDISQLTWSIVIAIYRFYISLTYFYKTKIVFVRGPSFDKIKRNFFSNFDHKGDPYKKYHKICCS